MSTAERINLIETSIGCKYVQKAPHFVTYHYFDYVTGWDEDNNPETIRFSLHKDMLDVEAAVKLLIERSYMNGFENGRSFGRTEVGQLNKNL